MSRTTILLGVLSLAAIALFARADDGLDLPVEPPQVSVAHPASSSITVVKAAQAAVRPLAPAPPAPIAPLPPSDPPPSFFGRDLDAHGSIVFVIDTSESMEYANGQYVYGSNERASRMWRAQTELRRSVSRLARSFRFDVIVYDCTVRPMWGELRDASPANLAEADHWISMLHPGGATGTGPAVAWALAEARDNKLVVLLTDGDPNCGVDDWWSGDETRREHLDMIRRANKQAARVDVFGIEAQGVFRTFCLDLSSQNSGTYTDVR